MAETQHIEFKSIRKIRRKHPEWSDLAAECVGFANTQGGTLIIGVEDGNDEPPDDQRISDDELNTTIRRLKGNTENVGFGECKIITTETGGQCLSLRILLSRNIIATTTSGRVYLRLQEECRPMSGHDFALLAEVKTAFQWELASVGQFTLSEIDSEKAKSFLSDIQSPQNPNVSDFIKEKSGVEIYRHFQFLDGDHLTNLGVLWLGTPAMRAKLQYPLTAQHSISSMTRWRTRSGRNPGTPTISTLRN